MSMRALRIDFNRQRRVTALGIVLLLAGSGAAASMALQYRLAAERLAGLQAKVDDVSRHAQQRSATDSLPPLEADLPYMQEVLRRINLPWDGLFAVLEGAAAEDVTLLGLRPETARGLVRIEGESRDLFAMLDYAQRVQDAKYFQEVVLTEHEIVRQGGDKPVHFQLQAKWKL